MKIAYVIGGLPFGGVERWLLDLLLEYRRYPEMSFRVFNLSGTGVMASAYRETGFEVVDIVPGSKSAINTHRFDTTLKLRKALRAFQPDLIHTMHYSANYHGRLAAIGMKVPVLTHLRNIKHERSLSRRFHDKALSYLTDAYLAVSKAVAEVIEQDHNLAKRPVKVLYNALDPARLEVEPLDLQSEFGIAGPYVIAVGRYVRQKNFDLLLQALAVMRERGCKASLVLVGDGTDRNKLEGLCDQLGLRSQVVFTGFRPDVAAFLRAADIFALAPQYEGFLIAHLEAMYCGLPAVLTACVPSLEIASEAALVCEPNPEDIADKLMRLLGDKELYSKLSANARAVAETLTMEKYAAKLLRLYQAMLTGEDIAGMNFDQ